MTPLLESNKRLASSKRLAAGLALLLGLLLSAGVVRAQAKSGADDSEVALTKARAAFSQGALLAKQMRWGDALVRFEASAKIRAHAATSYNIGICLRALGRYTQARSWFRSGLSQDQAAGNKELSASTVANSRAYLAEIGRVLATLDVRLEPVSATITVDGRPLELVSRDKKGKPTLLAGTAAAGPGKPAPAARFELVLDPGAHVFVLSRAGFSDAVVRKTVAPASRGTLELVLRRLAATLHIDSNQPQAAVSVDGLDMGLVPISLQRPAGRYQVAVRKLGFVGYEAEVKLEPAQKMDLMARLQPRAVGLHERWWFWTAVGAAVAGGVVITYFAARPEPTRPALSDGGLGWTIEVP